MEPRIYVASLSDYNAGTLHGVWIDLADADVDDVNRQIADMLAESPEAMATGEPAEEWAIHDHEGFGPLMVSEFSDLEGLIETALVLAEDMGEAAALFADNYHMDADDTDWIDWWREIEHDVYVGSLRDFAEERFFDWFEVPDSVASYIDFDAFARDLGHDGYWEEGGYVFPPAP